MKRCCTCHEEKPLEAFSKSRRQKDGLDRRCKACRQAEWHARYDRTVAYWERTKEQRAEWRRQYTIKQRESGWYRTEEHKAKKNAHLAKLRIEALVHYAGDPPTCACCHEGHVEFLTFDHMDGGGAQHRREIGYARLSIWLRKEGYPEGFQVLCFNCNASRGMRGYCPCQPTDNWVEPEYIPVKERI